MKNVWILVKTLHYVFTKANPMKSHASMNRIYRLVFNAALGIWVAVAENARGKGKGGRAASAGPARVIAESKNPFALSLSKGFDKLSPNGVH